MRGTMLVLVACLYGSCDKNRVFEKNVSVPEHTWSQSDSYAFDVTIEDTAELYDIYAVVRHSNDYKYVNLWVSLHTRFPSGNTGVVKENLQLGDNQTEKWLGDCIADICDIRIPLVANHRFSESGSYTFELRHVMWDEPLEDVMSVGLRVERRS